MGRIAIEGFYDNIVDLTDEERAEIALVAEDEEALKAQLGIDALWGEPGWTSREREWGRPTLDLNGIWGGFQGEGIKTVTPSERTSRSPAAWCRIRIRRQSSTPSDVTWKPTDRRARRLRSSACRVPPHLLPSIAATRCTRPRKSC
jgi:hypothetical protein